MHITILGTGRAGTSLQRALLAHGVTVDLLAHDATITPSTDVVIVAVPDDAIASVASSLPRGPYLVAHLAGSRGLDVLAPHDRVASLHPLAVLSSPEVGATRLVGATWAVEGDPAVRDIVALLGGTWREVSSRVSYHAAAVVTANHVTALMAHLEHIAHDAGLELADFNGLLQQALEDVNRVGPRAALTGPASRGDVATIDAHLAALPASERPLYVALSRAAFELAESATALQK